MGIELTKEELRPLTAGFRICAACFEPYEWRLQGALTRQRCSCPDKVPVSDARWPGYDFNEHLHLCECCSMEPLRSGSKWSVWFCEQCHQWVSDLNQRVGFSAIPIGRHSLMNGMGLCGDRLRESEGDLPDGLVEAFHRNLTGLLGAIDHLHQFASTRRHQLAFWLDFPSDEDISLAEWLEVVAESAAKDPRRLSKTASYEALERWFTDPFDSA